MKTTEITDKENIIELLKIQINLANKTYRTGEAIISDSKYDDLLDELAVLSPNDELLKKVGISVADDSRKRKLPIKMASMNKIKTIEEYKDWLRLKKIPEDTYMILTPKFDGASLCVNEETAEAFTRGDGILGQLSTEHLKLINPKKHGKKFFTVGEVIMKKSVFNNKYKGEYKNPRNLVSGKMNEKVPSDILKDLSYIRYGLESFDKDERDDKEIQLIILNALNASKVEYKKVMAKDVTTELLVGLFMEWGQEFELDGVIVEVNDFKLREKLGREKTTENPEFARAFKGNFEQVKETVCTGLTFQVTKNGSIKPVAQIEGVELDGAFVTNVTAVNARFVNAYKLKKGSKVFVKRSGMVIPLFVKIEGVEVDVLNLPKGSSELPIKNCPVCNEKTSWNENKVDVMCTNKECVGVNLQKIISFFETLEVENVSDGVCNQLWESGYDTIEKILKMSVKDMLVLPGFQERKAEKTYEAIHSKLKDVSLAKLQHASSCFFGLGSKKLELLEHFIKVPTMAEIEVIPGFSDISARIYLDGIENFNNFVKDLPITIKKTQKVMKTSNSLEGQGYCFTGIRRKDLEPIIETKGGIITSSVTKATTVLVCKEIDGSSAKQQKAEKMGLRVITVEELEKELGV